MKPRLHKIVVHVSFGGIGDISVWKCWSKERAAFGMGSGTRVISAIGTRPDDAFKNWETMIALAIQKGRIGRGAFAPRKKVEGP